MTNATTLYIPIRRAADGTETKCTEEAQISPWFCGKPEPINPIIRIERVIVKQVSAL